MPVVGRLSLGFDASRRAAALWLCLVVWMGTGWGLSPRAFGADSTPDTDDSRKISGPPPGERRPWVEELRRRDPEAFEKLREELRNLPPAERQKRLREVREKLGASMREELEKRREELQKLPPEEREARLKELRERLAERRNAMTPDERTLRRQEIRARFEKQLRELEKKKAAGSLTPEEAKRLERLQTIGERFKQAEEHAGGIARPAKP
jgi:hypothetical protein